MNEKIVWASKEVFEQKHDPFTHSLVKSEYFGHGISMALAVVFLVLYFRRMKKSGLSPWQFRKKMQLFRDYENQLGRIIIKAKKLKESHRKNNLTTQYHEDKKELHQHLIQVLSYGQKLRIQHQEHENFMGKKANSKKR